MRGRTRPTPWVRFFIAQNPPAARQLPPHARSGHPTPHTERTKTMPFQIGQSGNPAGRPRGARNKRTLALESIMDGESEVITRKVVEMAKGGSIAAIRLVIDRL